MQINHKLLGNRIGFEIVMPTELMENNAGLILESSEKDLIQYGKVIALGTGIPEAYKSIKLGDYISYNYTGIMLRTDAVKPSIRFATCPAENVIDIVTPKENIVAQQQQVLLK